MKIEILVVNMSLFFSCMVFADMHISKVVIPSAGYGTRMLPCTKSIPKELLPFVNKKPAAQVIVEECLKAGLHECCFIVSEDKKAIQDYFTHSNVFEAALNNLGKLHYLDNLNTIIDHTSFSYINQREMKGLGDAVLQARDYINNEYFAVIVPDMLFLDADSVMEQVVNIAREYNATVIAVQKVAPEHIHAYGTIKIGTTLNEKLFEISDLVEKPKTAAQAPSLYAIMGRYVFSPTIFDAIEAIADKAHGEIQLTDAITYLVNHGERVLAYDIDGTLFDIGQPHGWFAANVYLGMQDPTCVQHIKELLPNIKI